MALHKHALIRYRIIDSMLRNPYRKYPTIEEIRKKCEDSLFGSDQGEHICISTIEKDLKAMRTDMELGFEAPIKFSRKHLGYFYTDEDYTIQKVPLKKDDIETIKFAANTLFNFRETELFSEFKFAIEKIFDRLNITPEVEDDNLQKLVQFDSFPDYPGSEYLSDLYNAIVNKKTIKITHQKFNSSDSSVREIHPYLLKEYRYRWYVIAFSPNKNKVLTYALDRILSVQTLDTNFDLIHGFDPDAFFKNAFGITQTDDKAQEVILRFKNTQFGYLKTQPLHSSQKIKEFDDYFEVSIFVIPAFELFEKILSYGNTVKVIKPELVKNKIIKSISQSLKDYQE